MKLNKHSLIAIILLITILILGCTCSASDLISNQLGGLINQGVEQAEEIVSELPEQIQNAAEENSAEEAAEEPEEQSEPLPAEPANAVQENDTISISENSLSDLTSFRYEYTIDATGTDGDGGSLDQHIEIMVEMINPENKMHQQINASGTGSEAIQGALHIFIVDDYTYIFQPDETEMPCLMVSGGEENFADFEYLEPEDYFDSIVVGSLVEEGVMVNGVRCNHYHVTETGVEMQDIQSQEGEIFIDQESGHIIRYIGKAVGTVDTGEGLGNGEFKWKYDLKDMNQVQDIVLPPACAEQTDATTDIPVPPNAENKESFAGVITFETSDEVDAVTEWYQDSLPDNGWTITEDSSYAGVATINAEKDGKSIIILITASDGVTTVLITPMQ